MSRPAVRLRAWWFSGALLLAGLVVAGVSDRLLLGGLLMAAAFVVALALRVGLSEERAGGLHVRSRGLDVLFYTAASIDVAGATLIVTHDLEPRLLLAVNAVFGAVLLSMWSRAVRS